MQLSAASEQQQRQQRRLPSVKSSLMSLLIFIDTPERATVSRPFTSEAVPDRGRERERMRTNLTSCLNSCYRILFKFYPAQFQLKISLAPSINNAAPHGVLAPATAPSRHAPLLLGWVQLAYVAHIHNILHGMYSMYSVGLELWRRLFSPFCS